MKKLVVIWSNGDREKFAMDRDFIEEYKILFRGDWKYIQIVEENFALNLSHARKVCFEDEQE